MFKYTPKFIKLLVALTLFEVALFTIFRFVFFLLFSDVSFSDSLYSFWIGLRFDIQLAVLLNLPIFLLGGIKWISPLQTKFGEWLWKLYFILYNFAILYIYIGDIAYYDFFKKRVDATVTRFFYDIEEATTMLVQGYPVFKVLIGFILFIALTYFIFTKLLKVLNNSEKPNLGRLSKIVIYTVFTIVFIFGGYGKLELYPLRWSDAFHSANNFQSYLASNPVTYFANTFKNRDAKYDKKLTKKYYNNVANFLEIDIKDPEQLSFARTVNSNMDKKFQFKTKPNVVFVICESMAYPRTSISNNPLNPTPFMKKLSEEGLSYSRYFTPHAGTARSIFTALTGMADVERIKTTSRNPLAVEQNIPFNSSKDYIKQYFIGGSLSWGNVRGVISNIEGAKTYEKSSYKYPAIDVWGVSDIDLLREVNDNIKQHTKPFISIVQLAGNHSPYTIPEVNYGFKKRDDISKEDLKKYSFDGSIEDFNAQYFMDYSIEHFITLAKKEKYFDNTIFIFVGDHGLPKNSVHMKPNSLDLTSIHTPLIIYAPKLIKPDKKDYPVSEVDIATTIASITSNKYIDSSFGRNLLAKDFDKKPHYTYFMTHESNPTINLIGDDYILKVRADGTDTRLFKYEDFNKDDKKNYSKEQAKLTDEMRSLTRGIYEATRYTRFNNGSKKVKEKIEQLSK